MAILYNNTPRKYLGYKTPNEVLFNETKNKGAHSGCGSKIK